MTRLCLRNDFFILCVRVANRKYYLSFLTGLCIFSIYSCFISAYEKSFFHLLPCFHPTSSEVIITQVTAEAIKGACTWRTRHVLVRARSAAPDPGCATDGQLFFEWSCCSPQFLSDNSYLKLVLQRSVSSDIRESKH